MNRIYRNEALLYGALAVVLAAIGFIELIFIMKKI